MIYNIQNTTYHIYTTEIKLKKENLIKEKKKLEEDLKNFTNNKKTYDENMKYENQKEALQQKKNQLKLKLALTRNRKNRMSLSSFLNKNINFTLVKTNKEKEKLSFHGIDFSEERNKSKKNNYSQSNTSIQKVFISDSHKNSYINNSNSSTKPISNLFNRSSVISPIVSITTIGNLKKQNENSILSFSSAASHVPTLAGNKKSIKSTISVVGAGSSKALNSINMNSNLYEAIPESQIEDTSKYSSSRSVYIENKYEENNEKMTYRIKQKKNYSNKSLDKDVEIGGRDDKDTESKEKTSSQMKINENNKNMSNSSSKFYTQTVEIHLSSSKNSNNHIGFNPLLDSLNSISGSQFISSTSNSINNKNPIKIKGSIMK